MGFKSKKKTNNRPVAKTPTEINISETNNDDQNENEQNEDLSGASEINVSTTLKAVKRKGSDNEDQDSDESAKKIKKKKKKQPIQTDSTEKKGKKSIRQMKKEKHAQRQAEAEAASKDQLKSQCTNYLSQWKHDRQNWKFMKAKQVWLYKNKFSVNLVPDASWPVFLEYFESAKGNIRKMLVDDANVVIKQMDEWTEKQEQGGNDANEKEEATVEESDVQKPDESIYNRARSLIQCLGE